MRRFVSVWLVMLALAGCAARSAGTGQTYSTHGPTQTEPPPSEVSTAGTVLSVVGTPFFLVFKAAVCAATVAVAAPSAAIIGLTDRAYYERKRQELDEGFASNCGPPYILYR